MIGKHVPFLLALDFAPRIGQKTLMKYAKTEDAVQDLDYESVIASSSINRIKKITPSTWQECLQKAQAEIDKANDLHIHIISYLDPEYPINMLSLPDAPILLYVQGNYKALNHDKMVAVIGTRTPSEYGREIDTSFSTILVKDGFVTVAGLAQGCDTYAHLATIKAGGATIAIMGASLDQPVYPAENKDLADQIIKSGGALVSSFKFGTKLRHYNFAVRDEWQCGVSDGVLAIETMVKGGTRIAMHHAFLEKRPLAVVDYRQDHEEDLTDLPTFQGNLDSIEHENAVSLYSQKSLKDFEKMMLADRKKRLGH